jgi:multiple sugar transport system substrate-binding protein
MSRNSFRLAVSLLLLASLLLTACGPAATEAPPAPTEAPPEEPEAPPEEPEAPPAEAEKVIVQIFVGMGTGTSPEQIEQEELLSDEFNATHDDIEIEWLIVPYEESRDRYLAMLAGGTPPGLVGPAGVETHAEFLDTWADVTPFIDAEKYDLSDFYGPTVELTQYPDKNIGLPLGVYPSLIFYNKDLFDAAGVDYPTHDYADTSWNLDALREMGMKLTLDANGNDATSPDFDPDTIAQWGFDDSWANPRAILATFGAPNGGRPTDDTYMKAVVNSEEWVQGLQWFSDGIWVDHFIPDYAGQDIFYAVAGDPFSGGVLAMHFSHTWMFGEGINAELPFEYDFAPVPYNFVGTKVCRIHADNFLIPDDFEHKEASWEVMKWLAAPERISDVCLIYGCIPARESVAEEYAALLAESQPGTDLDVIFEAIDYLDKPHHEEWVPQFARVNEELGVVIDLIFTGENTDAQSVLDEANANIQKLLDEYWESQ